MCVGKQVSRRHTPNFWPSDGLWRTRLEETLTFRKDRVSRQRRASLAARYGVCPTMKNRVRPLTSRNVNDLSYLRDVRYAAMRATLANPRSTETATRSDSLRNPPRSLGASLTRFLSQLACKTKSRGIKTRAVRISLVRTGTARDRKT